MSLTKSTRPWFQAHSNMSDEPIPSPMQQDEEGAVIETAAPAEEAQVEAPVEKDADQLRDEKCIPVARKMFESVAAKMIPEDANEVVDYNPVLIDLLTEGLAADLNMTTETPYVFQLMLGILSGLNRTVQKATVTPIDDVRYGKIGRKILQITADANVTLGSVTVEQTDADFASALEQINALFAEEKLTMMEVKYIMDNIFESFTAVNNGFSASTEQSFKLAEEKLWKVQDMTDVTMGLMDRVMKQQDT